MIFLVSRLTPRSQPVFTFDVKMVHVLEEKHRLWKVHEHGEVLPQGSPSWLPAHRPSLRPGAMFQRYMPIWELMYLLVTNMIIIKKLGQFESFKAFDALSQLNWTYTTAKLLRTMKPQHFQTGCGRGIAACSGQTDQALMCRCPHQVGVANRISSLANFSRSAAE